MRKLVSVLLTLVVAVSLLVVPAVVSADPEPTLTIGDISTSPGGTVTVPIMANDVASFMEAAIDLRYDAGVVAVTEVTVGNGPALVDYKISPGHMNTMQFGFGGGPWEGDVIIAYVTFEATGSVGDNCALYFSVEGWEGFLPTHLSDMGGTDIPLTLVDGTFTIEYGNTVGLTAETSTITAISVTPTSIDFGTVTPGTPTPGNNITVENIGGVTVNVDAWLENPQTGTVFNYLKLGGVPSPGYSGDWADYIISGLKPSLSKSLTTHLVVPETYSGKGIETATLIFEATAL